MFSLIAGQSTFQTTDLIAVTCSGVGVSCDEKRKTTDEGKEQSLRAEDRLLVLLLIQPSILPVVNVIRMKNEEDYYGIMGVDETATASEIRRAYLDLSRHLHPDKHPEASPADKKAYTEAFQTMNQAYEVLRDYRELYDL